jgi:hypothetical protein
MRTIPKISVVPVSVLKQKNRLAVSAPYSPASKDYSEEKSKAYNSWSYPRCHQLAVLYQKNEIPQNDVSTLLAYRSEDSFYTCAMVKVENRNLYISSNF